MTGNPSRIIQENYLVLFVRFFGFVGPFRLLMILEKAHASGGFCHLFSQASVVAFFAVTYLPAPPTTHSPSSEMKVVERSFGLSLSLLVPSRPFILVRSPQEHCNAHLFVGILFVTHEYIWDFLKLTESQ